MIPGEMKVAAGDLELNKDRKTVKLQITNSGDRPIQVGSHYHFYETNAALKFDRKAAYGCRLNIAAGTAGALRAGTDALRRAGGARRASARFFGFNAQVNGKLK
jgi:urease subunit beta